MKTAAELFSLRTSVYQEYPTPPGLVHIRHERQSDGSIKTEVNAPAGVSYTIIKEEAT